MQLINYLHLAELPRGKLVNLRPETIEHEFVNALASRAKRTQFKVDADRWQPMSRADISGRIG